LIEVGAGVEQRKIIAKDLVKDLEAGDDDTALMMKYGLTAKELVFVLRKLVDSGLVTRVQLHERAGLTDSQITRAFVDTQDAIEELD
jgi:hypothetical protein